MTESPEVRCPICYEIDESHRWDMHLAERSDRAMIADQAEGDAKLPTTKAEVTAAILDILEGGAK